WNSPIPTEERIDPKGGTKKSLGRKSEIHRNFDFILPKFYFSVPWRIFVSSVAIGQFFRGGCAWSARLPRKKHPHLLSGEGADAICCGVAFVAKPIFR
ncbi:hypothetical protein, partial [Porphyromonas uenonis]|uniref:hypothetical protein n=1 Tax=Porphyromonas uenonis TaxID=281920 RepID=UPI0005869475